MPITIGSNIASSLAQRQLARSSSELEAARLRLASGKRINTASDDAAGLSISDALNASTRVLGQALRNLNDGISILSIADAASGELNFILIRQKELAEQAGNGIYGTAQRNALDQEAQALAAEYNRILSVTKFNNLGVFDQLGAGISIQGGASDGEILLVRTGAASSTAITQITRVSTSASGAQANGDSADPQATPDGRYVVFSSTASNLVAGDSNGAADIFVKDTRTGDITLVSASASGVIGNGGSTAPRISSDGRYVAFQSNASNLVVGDTNSNTDIFVKDLSTGAVTRVSTSSSGTEAAGNSSSAQLSADGRYVVFTSSASNLVAGDGNFASDVFMKDTATGTTTRLSTSTAGVEGNGGSLDGRISADGRYIVFASDASNLIAGDTNSVMDIFVKDAVSGTTTRVSTSSVGTEGNNLSSNPTISPDGRYVGFWSFATNLIAGDSNGLWDSFVKDLVTGITARTSTSSSGVEGNGSSFYLDVSAGGRYVAFESQASNLVAGDSNSTFDVFLKDTSSGATTLLSSSSSALIGNGSSNRPLITSNGAYVVFESGASNLVTGDTNGVRDIFITPTGVAGVATGGGSSLSPLVGIDLTSASAARSSLDLIDEYLVNVSQFRGELGAALYRIGVLASKVRTQQENELQARSRILDADVAAEAARVTTLTILQQTAAAVLGQANQQPRIALQLL